MNKDLTITATTDGTLIISSKELSLSEMERRLIGKLAETPNRTVSRWSLFLAMYPKEEGRPLPKNVDMHIRRLRMKMEKVHPGASKYLHTRHGQGFILYLQSTPTDTS